MTKYIYLKFVSERGPKRAPILITTEGSVCTFVIYLLY